MRYLSILLLCAASLSAQTIIGGKTVTGGKTIISVPGVITPPPPSGITSDFFKTSWNSGVPAVWPPKDGAGAIATVTGARIHDDGMKLGQLFSCSGGVTCTPLGPFTGILNTFMNTNVPAFPVDVLYVFSDVPTGAAQGTDSNCSVTTSGCVPFTDSDSNQATCNSTPNSGGTQDSIVIANCGNGTNAQFKYMVWKILSTYSFQAVECWNEPDGAGNFWSNNASFGGLGHAPSAKNQPPLVRMAAMCNIVKKIANAIDPTIKVYSPSFHGPTAATWMHYYVTTTFNDSGCNSACGANIGGITWPAASNVSALTTFNYTNAHIRGGGSGTGEGGGNQSPEAFLGQYANVLAEVNADGLPSLIIDDENGPVNKTGVCQTSSYDSLAYYVAAGLLTRASVNLYRTYYYQWDSRANAPACVNDTGASGPAGTVAATAWDTVAGWLIGNTASATINTGTNYTVPITTAASVSEKAVWNTATVNLSLGNVTIFAGNAVYACPLSNCLPLSGEYVTITGYAAANNGSFMVNASSAGSITTNNTAGVAATGTGTANYLPLMCGTSCPTQTITPFTHWTDLTGTPHSAPGSVFPVGGKPILLTP